MKKILIGVMPQDKIRQRVIAIARGEHTPKRNEPKIWFPSIKSATEVLTGLPNRLRQLLSALHE
jgi:predicted transcriptional regulator